LDPIMDPDIVAEHYHTHHHPERFSFRDVLGPNFLPVCFLEFHSLITSQPAQH
jgi:hypothetical protein